MTLIYKLDLDILKMYLHAKNEVLGQGFQKSEHEQDTDKHTQTHRLRHTDKHTQTHRLRQTERIRPVCRILLQRGFENSGRGEARPKGLKPEA